MQRLPSSNNTRPYLESLSHHSHHRPRPGSWAHTLVAASAAFDARHLGHGLGAFEDALIAQASAVEHEIERYEAHLKQKLDSALHGPVEECDRSIAIYPKLDLTSLDIWDGIPYEEGSLQKLIIAESAILNSDGNPDSMSASSTPASFSVPCGTTTPTWPLDDADFMYRLRKAALLLHASRTGPNKDFTPEANPRESQPLLEAGDEGQELNDLVTAVPVVVDVLNNICDIPDVFATRLLFEYSKPGDTGLFRWDEFAPPPGHRQSWLDQLMRIDLREKARLGLAQTLIYSLSSHAAFGAQFGVFVCCTRFVRVFTCQDTILLDLLLPEGEMGVSDLLKRLDLADRLPHDFLLPEAMPNAWRRLNADSIQVYLNVFAASFALNDQITSECLRRPSPLSPSRLSALLNTITKLNDGLEPHADLVAAARSKRRGNLPPHDASPSGAGSGDEALGPHDALMADFGLDEDLPLGAEASTYSLWNSARHRRDFEILLRALNANNPRIVIISPARMDEFLREAGNDMFSEATDTSVTAPVCDSLHTTPVRSPSTSTCGSSPVLQPPERPTAGRASDRRASSKHMEDSTFTQTSLDSVVLNA
ncbi:uncharacterized protein EHS24_008807 [Apiotrichum porosum]|uniref:Uncharacterized protein n=1 Tax=Apiotrichum porosum TaxID=105984 RepID=A0A427XNA9_9TREE|nr:uncharacterized protein EHS24_008807 [Apiotrichum porosum]RSH80234.1 hypothetical protein EHS24_008807 [Apiotrichum porosum]